MSLDADGFMRSFQAFWSAPTPDTWQAIFTPQITLMIPPMVEPLTYEQLPGYMAELLKMIPDLTLEVHRWAPVQDGLLVEWTLNGTTAAGVLLKIDGVDRVILDGNQSSDSVAYLDPAPLLSALGATAG